MITPLSSNSTRTSSSIEVAIEKRIKTCRKDYQNHQPNKLITMQGGFNHLIKTILTQVIFLFHQLSPTKVSK